MRSGWVVKIVQKIVYIIIECPPTWLKMSQTLNFLEQCSQKNSKTKSFSATNGNASPSRHFGSSFGSHSRADYEPVGALHNNKGQTNGATYNNTTGNGNQPAGSNEMYDIPVGMCFFFPFIKSYPLWPGYIQTELQKFWKKCIFLESLALFNLFDSNIRCRAVTSR